MDRIPGMKRTITILAVTAAVAALGSCSSTNGDAPPAATSSTSVAATTSEVPKIDTAAYLAMARKDASDDVTDARLVKLGNALCADLRAGRWDHTTIDDDNQVGDLSVQMRVNIGFAAVHHLCQDQEAQYIKDAGGALGD